jgi:hypothetical protein
MDWNLVLINLIGALAYAARIAGVNTRRIAMSFALFNMLVLVSRTSNGLLAPLVAKRVENAISGGGRDHLLADFRWMMLSASLAVLIGIALVPMAQRLFSAAIGTMRKRPSLVRIAASGMTPSGLRAMRRSAVLPNPRTLLTMRRPREVGWGILIGNALAQGLLAVGVFASLYAGYLVPEFRVTASQLSAVINGVATILLFAVIDPQLSVLTDDVVDGTLGEAPFRRAVVWISFSRLAGTIAAQVLFVPAALIVAWIALRL